MKDVSDDEILVMLRSGKHTDRMDGLQALFSMHGGPVESFVKSRFGHYIDEKYVMNEVALNLHNGINEYDGRKTLRNWLLFLADHKAIDILRGRQASFERNKRLEGDHEKLRFAAESAGAVTDDDEFEVSDERLRHLPEAINSLPQSQRRVAEADLLAGGKADSKLLAARFSTTVAAIDTARCKYRAAIRRFFEDKAHAVKSDQSNP